MKKELCFDSEKYRCFISISLFYRCNFENTVYHPFPSFLLLMFLQNMPKPSVSLASAASQAFCSELFKLLSLCQWHCHPCAGLGSQRGSVTAGSGRLAWPRLMTAASPPPSQSLAQEVHSHTLSF